MKPSLIIIYSNGIKLVAMTLRKVSSHRFAKKWKRTVTLQVGGGPAAAFCYGKSTRPWCIWQPNSNNWLCVKWGRGNIFIFSCQTSRFRGGGGDWKKLVNKTRFYDVSSLSQPLTFTNYSAVETAGVWLRREWRWRWQERQSQRQHGTAEEDSSPWVSRLLHVSMFFGTPRVYTE